MQRHGTASFLLLQFKHDMFDTMYVWHLLSLVLFSDHNLLDNWKQHTDLFLHWDKETFKALFPFLTVTLNRCWIYREINAQHKLHLLLQSSTQCLLTCRTGVLFTTERLKDRIILSVLRTSHVLCFVLTPAELAHRMSRFSQTPKQHLLTVWVRRPC